MCIKHLSFLQVMKLIQEMI